MGTDGLICGDIGWWSGFKKGIDGFGDFGRGLGGIMEGMGTNNWVDKSHGSLIMSFIIAVDGREITLAI